MTLGQEPGPKLWHKVWVAAIVMATAISAFGMLGVFSVIDVAADLADGEVEEQTLDDYSPVKELSAENGTLVVVLEKNPRFEAAGALGEMEITHLQLTRSRGGVEGLENVTLGQNTYRFDLPSDSAGNYTFALQHREPAEPGLFGHGPRTENQVIEFQIDADGNLTVTEVPYDARYD